MQKNKIKTSYHFDDSPAFRRGRVKYSAYGVLAAVVFALGYQAGDQGIKAARLKPVQNAQRLFRPFSSFNFPTSVESSVAAEAVAAETMAAETMAEALPVGDNPLKQKSEERSGHRAKQQDREPDSDHSTREPSRSPQLASSQTWWIVKSPATRAPEAPRQESPLPAMSETVLPDYQDVYVAVYEGENLSEATRAQFEASLQMDPEDKLFVLNREIVSTDLGVDYEILVFDAQGETYLGSFSSGETNEFPFVGLPTLEPANPGSFPEVSNFLIFSKETEGMSDLFTSEPYLESLLKSAVSREPRKSLGTDPKSGLQMFSVFPGVYQLSNFLR